MTLDQVKLTLSRHKGDMQVIIFLPDGNKFVADRELWVEPSIGLRNQLIGILGQENVKI